jgi:hypothetical protein
VIDGVETALRPLPLRAEGRPMEIVRLDAVPESSTGRVPQAWRGLAVAAFALCAGSIWIPLHFGLEWYGSLHGGLKLLLAPVGAGALIAWFWLTRRCWRKLCRAFGPGNWALAVGPEALYLNICPQWGAELKAANVARVPFGEIVSVGRVCEDFDLGAGEELRLVHCLEIRLNHLDTTELETLCENSAHRMPVMVTTPGVIRVDWCGAEALAALSEHVSVVDGRQVAPPPGKSREADARILDFVEQGDRASAVRLVQDTYPMSLPEASQLVETLASSEKLEPV